MLKEDPPNPYFLLDSRTNQPLSLFHGTQQRFDAFKGELIWFTDDFEAAQTYAKGDGLVLTAHLSMNKPARDHDVMDAAREIGLDDDFLEDEYAAKVLEQQGVRGALQRRGFDGAVVSDSDSVGNVDITAYVVFNPEQISMNNKNHLVERALRAIDYLNEESMDRLNLKRMK